MSKPKQRKARFRDDWPKFADDVAQFLRRRGWEVIAVADIKVNSWENMKNELVIPFVGGKKRW